jgi:hypothetical protein
MGNSPNPFRDRTDLQLRLDQPHDVRLKVFDLQGRQVAERLYGLQSAGAHHLRFQNPRLGSGVYLYQVRLTDPATGRHDTLEGRMIMLQ